MLTFCTLFSGSSGNCAYVATERGGALIDCGMSGRMITEAMAAAGLDISAVRAILVTHEHSDHVKGVGVMSRKLNVPVYATPGTWDAMGDALGLIPESRRVRVSPGESFFLDGLDVSPFSIPHDAAEPVGYRFFAKSGSVAIATDLGYFSKTVESAVSGADAVLLESNHDPELLMHNPHYPPHLKSRILGRKGHLSNGDGARAAIKLVAAGARHLLLGHLSGENNTPDIAYRECFTALTEAGAEVGREVTLNVARRYQAGYLYRI